MSYITEKDIEYVVDKYQHSSYRQLYSSPRLPYYTAKFLRQYKRIPTTRTWRASDFADRINSEMQVRISRKTYQAQRPPRLSSEYQSSIVRKRKEKTDDWIRFFYKPVLIYSNRRKEGETNKLQEIRYELLELKNPGSHREFFIVERARNRFVRWEDLPDLDVIKEYLRKYGFPEDKFYSEEIFLDDIEHENGEIFLCVEKRDTAVFILNMCNELIRKPIKNVFEYFRK